MMKFSKKSWWFLGLFIVIGFIALQIPTTQLVGSGAKFTLFDAFAPIAGGFLGSIPGAISVLIMQILNLAWHGFNIPDAGTVIRLFPVMFAAIYFGSHTRLNIIVPILAMIAFVANPIGREVWYFSLFWLIPVAAYFFQDKSLIVKSLGATFAAHSVGGALWIWAFSLPKTVWISLIPIVAMERLIFALGIAASYLVANNVLNWINSKNYFSYKFPVNERYVWNS